MYWNIPAIQFGKKVMRNYNTLIDRYPGADGMKTGFICASGFNLVATATRGSRRLIAVVLGARSGMQRAEKAAQLLERGFSGNGGLSWLLPAGTVDALQPVDAAPLNLRDEICNARGRRRPPADNEESVAHTEESGSSLAMMTGFQLGPRTHGSLLGPLQPSMAPIPVYVGLAKSPGAVELASEPQPRKKPAKKTAAHDRSGAPGETTAAPTGAQRNTAASSKLRQAAKPSNAAAPKGGTTAAAPKTGASAAAPNTGSSSAAPKAASKTASTPASTAAAPKPRAAEGAAKPKPKPKPKAAAAPQ